MKKATIKDIAKAANVSIATVSYILNDVKTQSISDETRVKVLKIAQQLQYVTNRSARSLKLQKTGLIGILLFKDLQPHRWSELKYVKTLYRIERLCGQLGYHTIFMQIEGDAPSYDMIRERNLDGVFLMNVDQERFATISRYFGFGIPVFAIDSHIEDTIFHKVLPDFAAGFRTARERLGEEPHFLVLDAYNDSLLVGQIKRLSGMDGERIHVYEGPERLNAFLAKYPGSPGIVVGDFLASEVARTHDRIVAVCTSDCPEMLAERIAKVTFDLSDYKRIVDMMDRNIHDADHSNPEKFLYLPVNP